jgi:hypothetical protein
MPARKKALNTKPKAVAKLKPYHVEVGGLNESCCDFGTAAYKLGTTSRVRWSFVNEPGARHKALNHIDEHIATISKHVTAIEDRTRAIEALGHARVEINNATITDKPLTWKIQLDSYYDTWLVVKLYKGFGAAGPTWEGTLL